jgi:hypothetical protein
MQLAGYGRKGFGIESLFGTAIRGGSVDGNLEQGALITRWRGVTSENGRPSERPWSSILLHRRSSTSSANRASALDF